MKTWSRIIGIPVLLFGILFISLSRGEYVTPASSYHDIGETEHSLLVKLDNPGDIVEVRSEVMKTSNQFSVEPVDESLVRINFKDPDTKDTVEEDLSSLEVVDYVEENAQVQIHVNPDDPYYTTDDFNTSNLWGLAKIEADLAWDTTTGDNIVVAVIDTGIDWDHPDLVKNVWVNLGELTGFADNLMDFSTVTDTNANAVIDCDDLFDAVNSAVMDSVDTDSNGHIDDVCGWDFANNDNNPFDDHRHGTHVSGTVGALTNNGIGVAGVNWDVRIMPLKMLNSAGFGSYSDGIESLEYARVNGALVVNMSWGGSSSSQALQDKINELYQDDVVMVVSAGNGNTDATSSFPARSDNVITIGNTTYLDARSGTSNYGPKVEIAAPGTTILSTRSSSGWGCGPTHANPDYIYCSGTSMSAPHVAGVAALLRSDNASLTNYQVAQILQENSDPITPSQYIGYGRLNANNAITNNFITAGVVSAFTSNITVPDTSIEVGNPMSVTVTIRDGYNNPVSGKTVSLATSRGALDNITDVSPVTDANGEATFTIDSTTSGSFYIYATDTTGGNDLIISHQVDASFTATLDHFDITTIGQKRTKVAFQISITAKNVNNYTVGDHTGSTSISDLSGSVSPGSVSSFVNGVWTGNITVNNYKVSNRITATYGAKTGSSNTFNVVHPHVFFSSLSPSSGYISGGRTSKTFTLNGSNMRSGMTVLFQKSGQSDISCTSVNVQSSSKSTCMADFAGKAAGPWSIRLINSGINTNAYTKAGVLNVYRGSDLDGDFTVGIFDFSILLGDWGGGVGSFGDVNGDSSVDVFDFSIMLGEWGGY